MRHIPIRFAMTLSIGLTMTIFSAREPSAQTYTVIHNFSNGGDGGSPQAMLTRDAAGHLYGTTLSGGVGYGTVFKMTEQPGGWLFSTIYNFVGNNDGAGPYARVVIGPNGSLYGTTVSGGGGSGCADLGYSGCGTVYNLQPPLTVCKSFSCFWRENVLYRFANGTGGVYPFGSVAFDRSSNIYGTTNLGSGLGTVYELAHSGSGWTGSTLVSFSGSNGSEPYDTLVLDSSGNLYGSARGGGGSEQGVLFELSNTGSGWTENIIHSLSGNEGSQPFSGLIFDGSGNLYGTTSCGGTGSGGTVFELSPSGGSWQFTVLYSFTGSCQFGPADNLTMDASGNLYGTTYRDGANGLGSVFKLTPSNGSWAYTDLHDFNNDAGGCEPNGGVVLDSHGNIYGTTTACGPHQVGTVWEITP